MAITGGPLLGAAAAVAPGDDVAAIVVVRAARFRKERARSSGATRAAEHKTRRALQQMVTAVGPAPNQAAMPIPAATNPSLVLQTSTPAAPSQTAAPSLAIILIPAALSAPRPAAASSPTKVPILAVVLILTIVNTPSPTATSSLATTPNSTAALATTSTLGSGSTQSYQAASPCSGGRTIAVRALAFKKDRYRAGAVTRTAERKKRRALLQTSVLPIQAAASGPAAKAIPATTSSWNPVVAPSKPVAFSQVDEMSPPNTPSFDLVLTLAAMDQPKSTNDSTAQSNEVSRNTENLNLELTLSTLS